MFDKLPNEIITLIFSHLTTIKDIIHFASVDKRLYLFFKASDAITLPIVSLSNLPLIAYFTSGDKKILSIQEYLTISETIDVRFELMFDFWYDKITYLSYDYNSLQMKHKYIKNANHCFEKNETFHKFRKLNKLIVTYDNHKTKKLKLPSTVKHFESDEYDFDGGDSLKTLKVGLKKYSIQQKINFKIDLTTITHFEFCASNYNIPDLKSMVNLRILHINDYYDDNEILILPYGLEVFSGYNGTYELPNTIHTLSMFIQSSRVNNPILNLRLRKLSVLISCHGFYNLQNDYVNELSIIFTLGFNDQCLLHFPNVKNIHLIFDFYEPLQKINFTMYLLNQYTELDFLKIYDGELNYWRVIDATFLKLKKFEINSSYAGIFISHFHSYFTSPSSKKVKFDTSRIPSTTKNFIFKNHSGHSASTFNLPNLEYLELLLSRSETKYYPKIIHKDIDCIKMKYYGVDTCDLSQFTCRIFICDNEHDVVVKPPQGYSVLKLHNTILRPHFIHENLETIILDNECKIKECDLMNVKEVTLSKCLDISRLSYCSSCNITFIN